VATKTLSKRELEMQKAALAQLSGAGCTGALPEKPELFTLTIEADNFTAEFNDLDSYRVTQVKHELTQFCSSLRIIENTITVTKQEKE